MGVARGRGGGASNSSRKSQEPMRRGTVRTGRCGTRFDLPGAGDPRRRPGAHSTGEARPGLSLRGKRRISSRPDRDASLAVRPLPRRGPGPGSRAQGAGPGRREGSTDSSRRLRRLYTTADRWRRVFWVGFRRSPFRLYRDDFYL